MLNVKESNRMSLNIDEERWQAVETRDAGADGSFVYAVKTTGVYCRPSCPSRLALRRNVFFFPDGAAAVEGGYRPCKRCRPEELSPAERAAQAVTRACRMIDDSEDIPAIQTLADAVGLSRYHFHRMFKSITGVTPRAYAAERRASRLRAALAAGETVTAAIYGAGYGASSRFYEEAEARLGMRASDFKRGGEGLTIRFAVAATSLGPLLVAATCKGLCAIAFGDIPDVLVQELQDRFPKARLVGADAGFEQRVARISGYIERPAGSLDLPLDIQGTAFQQRVWAALRAIPAGETRSYAEVAAAIDAPKAHRAVARACASNPVAIAVPCHRVVRTDGSLSGYRWGVERKKALLDREAKA